MADGWVAAAPATAAAQHPPGAAAPPAVVDVLRRLEATSLLDAAARPLAALAGAVVRSPRAADGLRGAWLGHALHPASSWLARRRGAHARAVVLGVAGGVVATVGGYFGGHLTLVRKLGTADPAYGTDPPAS